MGEESHVREELDGGLVMATERIPGIRSVSVGIWLRQGAAHESGADLGLSHLLEHMVFKGTARRSARDIALALERRGGDLDAYTTREHTGYQARVLDEDLDVALDVLTDLVLEPALREEDLTLEREVVLEEIAGVEDTPDDLVFELHAETLWGAHPYGHSILGTRDTVGGASAADVRRVHEAAYRKPNMVVAAVGDVDHAELRGAVLERLGAARNGVGRREVAPPTPAAPGERRFARDAAQTHLVYGAPTFGHSDPRRYAMVLLSTAFGGGMSSRLFQRVREELGLAYAVFSFQSFYSRAGVAGVYVGTRPEWADRVDEVVRAEMRSVARDGLTPAELEDAKGQMKGQLVLSTESPASRLGRVAGAALLDEPFETTASLLEKIERVGADEVAALAAEHLDPDHQVVVRLGPEA